MLHLDLVGLPVVLELVHRVLLRGEARERVRTGADRVRVAPGVRALLVLPDVLGHDQRLGDDVLRGGVVLLEVDDEVVALRLERGDVLPRALEVERRELLDQVQREDDVVDGERLAVGPLHAVADRVVDGAGVRLGDLRGQPRCPGAVEHVDDDERLVDVGRGRALVHQVRVEVALHHRSALVCSQEHRVRGDGRVLLALDLDAAAGEREGCGCDHGERSESPSASPTRGS